MEYLMIFIIAFLLGFLFAFTLRLKALIKNLNELILIKYEKEKQKIIRIL